MKKLTSLICIVIILFLFNSTYVYADNLLLNSTFEDTSGTPPTNWTKNVSSATLTTSTTAKSGSYSASINKTNSATGTIYLYQDVDVESGSYYSLSGYAVKNDSKFSYVLLRISWRDSSTELSKTDSSQLTSDSSDFRSLSIDSVQAPSNAIKARIELVANITTINPTNPVLFDDITFSQVSAPIQPTATPTSTPNSTPTLTPTATPTPTPEKTVTPKPTPTSTPDISLTSMADDPATILGDQTESSPSPNSIGFSLENASSSADPSFLDKLTQTSPLAFVFVFLGIFFLGFAGYSFIKQKANQTSDTIDFTNENP